MRDEKPGEENDFRQTAFDALKDFTEEEEGRLKARETRDAEKAKKGSVRLTIQWLIIILCICVTIFQVPKLIAALNKAEKPLRIGTFATDERTDQCIRNLWRISRSFQEGKIPDGGIVCPASNKPYVIVKTAGNIIARSPSPELYGFTDIRVSRKNPVPEIVR